MLMMISYLFIEDNMILIIYFLTINKNYKKLKTIFFNKNLNL